MFLGEMQEDQLFWGEYWHIWGGLSTELVSIRSTEKAYTFWILRETDHTHHHSNIPVVKKFGEGRVFVAGDATHVHSLAAGGWVGRSRVSKYARHSRELGIHVEAV
ncbi:hypothetical protein JAAARDRAFT_201171 [Jaapia argillacea MUCL 33604]|uniref:FAD-binding domain-containing protein n=1 Tax=Jaapia argillacea MUCL 33604 TaxID=933084 RepID=A0A067PF09_9AGAM|nr:hypothetical protein JAAARDRAFT_201171 [Jaapia argillacea MUCL 33604]